MTGIYGVAPSFVDPPQFKVTNEMPYPPAAFRRPCHWAQLHAGIEHITPVWERNALIWRSRGLSVREIADGTGRTAPEVRAAIGRVERALVTWEREREWRTRNYPLQEPTSMLPGGASQKESKHIPHAGGTDPLRNAEHGASRHWAREHGATVLKAGGLRGIAFTQDGSAARADQHGE